MTDKQSINYRPGTEADSYQVFVVFETVLADMLKRVGEDTPTSIANPEALAKMWVERKSLYYHLARSADQFWIAESEGQVVGFIRSIVRGELQQLTEFFVLPKAQSGGIGGGLLQRALPKIKGTHRSIIATTNLNAQVLYLKSGVYPRVPLYYFGRTPEPVEHKNDLRFEPIESVSANILEVLAAIDLKILAHRRDVDHVWLNEDRQGFIYYRGGIAVGYGYPGMRNGPFALQDQADFPAVLAHAENLAAENEQEHFGLEVPMSNQSAVETLLARGFRLDAFMAVLMSDAPFGRFENYILTSPPFFL